MYQAEGFNLIYVFLFILFEGIGKSILFNSILNIAISDHCKLYGPMTKHRTTKHRKAKTRKTQNIERLNIEKKHRKKIEITSKKLRNIENFISIRL